MILIGRLRSPFYAWYGELPEIDHGDCRPRLKSELIFMPTFAERAHFNTCVLHPGEGGVLNKVLYGEALPSNLLLFKRGSPRDTGKFGPFTDVMKCL